MIRSFRSKALRHYVERGDRSKLSVVNLRRLDTILETLDEAAHLDDMNVSGWRFHALRGEMNGRFAVSVNGNWRVTFGWEGADAVDVDLEDYH